MIVFLVEAVIVMVSSWLFAKKYFDTRLFSESILTWFILFFSQIVLVELSLGIIGKLYFGYVFLTHLLIFALAVLLCPDREGIVFSKPKIDFFIKNNLLLFAFAVFVSFALVKVYINLINPPLSPNSMAQHLLFPAAWIKGGNLDTPFQIFGSIPILNPNGFETSSGSYYPINGQLFFTWLMMPLRNAFLADAGETPFYIIGIIAVYAILRQYNVNKNTALLSGFLWALMPNLFKQLRTGSEIDAICAVLFLLVFYTLLLLKRGFSLRNAFLFGISLGLLIGTKVINLVWLAAFTPVICYILYNALKASKFALSKALSFLGAIVLMIILFGSFIYVKNYFFTGNPLFPYNLKILGNTIFKGILDNAEYKAQVAAWGWDLRRIFFREGLGVQFLALILPATFIPLLFCGYLKAKVKPFGEYLLLFATPLIMLILFGAAINISTMRYLYPYFSLGLLTAVIFINNLPRGDKYLAITAFISIVYASFELANGYELVVSLLLSIALTVILIVYKKQIAEFYKSRAFAKAALIVLLLMAFVLVYLNNKYDKEEFERYSFGFKRKEAWQADTGKGWKVFNDLTKDGTKVAYTGRQEYYPLFGTRLKNSVKYVSVNEKEITPYNKPDGLYRKVKDYAAWMKNLKKDEIEFLYVSQPYFNNRESQDPAKFPIEDEWAAANSAEFSLVFNNSMAHIYKVSIK